MKTRTKFATAATLLGLIILGLFFFCYHVQRHFFPPEYRDVIRKYSEENGLDPLLVASIVYRESRYDKFAVSSSSARGLMQIMPGTGQDIAARLKIDPYSVDDLFDPDTNVRFGCHYFAKMMKDFDSDPVLALAAYNSGPENVRKYLNDQGGSSEDLAENYGFTETRDYVKKVLKVHWALRLCDKLIDI